MSSDTTASSFRAKAGVVGGVLLICDSIASYVYMHDLFFGVPHFTLNSPRGRNEVGYALSSLALAGIGALGIYFSIRARKNN